MHSTRIRLGLPILKISNVRRKGVVCRKSKLTIDTWPNKALRIKEAYIVPEEAAICTPKRKPKMKDNARIGGYNLRNIMHSENEKRIFMERSDLRDCSKKALINNSCKPDTKAQQYSKESSCMNTILQKKQYFKMICIFLRFL